MKYILLFFALCGFSLFVPAQTFPVDAGMDAHICADSAPGVILSPTINGGMGPYFYSWTPSAGLNDSTILNPIRTTGRYHHLLFDGHRRQQ